MLFQQLPQAAHGIRLEIKGPHKGGRTGSRSGSAADRAWKRYRFAGLDGFFGAGFGAGGGGGGGAGATGVMTGC